MNLIGIDSYAKSNEIDRYLPEYEKRFQQMMRLLTTQLGEGALVCQSLTASAKYFFALYVSKEKALEIADRAGNLSELNSVLSLRNKTALKDLKKLCDENCFFYPFMAFCVQIMEDEMHKFEKLGSMATKLIQKDLKPKA